MESCVMVRIREEEGAEDGDRHHQVERSEPSCANPWTMAVRPVVCRDYIGNFRALRAHG